MADDFVYNWLKEIRWHADPFVQDIHEPVDQFYAGYEKEREKLNLFVINNGSFGSVTGEPGAGKTMLIKWLVEKLDKHRKRFMITTITKPEYKDEKKFLEALYLPFEAEHPLRTAMARMLGKKEKITKLNIDKFLKERAKTRRYVLIIDDAEGLQQEDIGLLQRIKAIQNASIVLSGQRKELEKLKLKDLGKDELCIELKGLSFDASKLMLKKRIEAVGGHDVWPFKDKILKDLFAMVDYIPGRILKVAEERAKELCVEIKIGRIRHEEQEPEHVYMQTEVVQQLIQPEIKPKHSILGIRFTIKDDEEPEKKDERKKDEKKKEDRKPAEREPEVKEEKPSQAVLKLDVKREEPKEEKQKESEAIHIDLGLVKDVDEMAKPKPTPKELAEQRQHEELISSITKKVVKPEKGEKAAVVEVKRGGKKRKR